MISRQVLARGVVALRRQRGWTQANLAEAAELSVQFVSAIEQGAKAPSFETLDSLCAAFRVRPSDVFAAGEDAGQGKRKRPVGREILGVVEALPVERDAEMIDLLHAVSRVIAPKAKLPPIGASGSAVKALGRKPRKRA